MTAIASSIADKYIGRDGGRPTGGPLSFVELQWVRRARLRNGWFPTDGDGLPSLSELESLRDRGLVLGPPWRVTKHAIEISRELDGVTRPFDRQPEEALTPHQALKVLRRGMRDLLREIEVETSSSPFVGRTFADVERELLLATLDHCGQNRTRAAKMLGVSVRTVRNKLRQLI